MDDTEFLQHVGFLTLRHLRVTRVAAMVSLLPCQVYNPLCSYMQITDPQACGRVLLKRLWGET